MGGNGEFAPHNCTNALPTGVNCIPPGAGGGCVTTGPFKNYSVDFAPVAPSLAVVELENLTLPFLSYYPRCLKRDVSPWVSGNWSKDIDSYTLLTQNPDIYWFQTVMQGNSFIDGFFGVHSAGSSFLLLPNFLQKFLAYQQQAITPSAVTQVEISSLLLEIQPSSCIMRRSTARTGYGKIKT
jgi:hypothetical protein